MKKKINLPHLISIQRLLGIIVISIFFGGTVTQVQSQDKARYDNVKDALSQSNRLRGGSGPQNVQWIDGGVQYSYMGFNSDNGKQEIRVHDPATGEDQLIFDGDGITYPNSDDPFTYQSYQWSDDASFLLFQTDFRPVYRRSGISDYYLFSLEDSTLTLVADDARTADLSPNGKMIGYERKGNLFMLNLQTMEETQLTFDQQDLIYNGRFGWVYEEEFGLPQAWKWSPDSKYIAFWQTDERDVPIYQITDYSGQQPEYSEIPYPKVGDKNPKVKIGVIDIESTKRTWMKVPLKGGYIPRIYWTSNTGQLAVVRFNRQQTDLSLFFHDVATGDGKLVMRETSDQWIDVFDFFAGIMHFFYFPENSEEFFWLSERDGFAHIYRYDYEGNLINQVTDGNWEVTYVHAVDADDKKIYYSSTEVSPLQRHLYAVNFKGKKKKRLTEQEGRHNVNMAPNAKYFIDRYSNIDTPTKVDLRDNKGNLVKALEKNERVHKYLQNNVYAPRELTSFVNSSGDKIDMYVIKPPNFDSTKAYPLFLSIYGGPGAQSVYNEFGTSGWNQYLAQQGYVIASVNNRGSGGYGKEFEKMVYKQLGKFESQDFVEAAQYLGSKPWVDENRMAIRGHSYGGYMTTYTMTRRPGTFKVGLAGAPVTDWRLYDTIYAERYMGLKENNIEGYNKSSPITFAGDLEGELMIVHSAMDDNVHMQNTMQLITAFTNAGEDVDLRIYPPGRHGVAYNRTSYYLLYETLTGFLEENLNRRGFTEVE